jgi:hypothetical protein
LLLLSIAWPGLGGCAEGARGAANDAGWVGSPGDGDAYADTGTPPVTEPQTGDGDDQTVDPTTSYDSGTGSSSDPTGGTLGSAGGSSGLPTASDLLCGLFGGCDDAGTSSSSGGNSSGTDGGSADPACQNKSCLSIYDCQLWYPSSCGFTACTNSVCQ